eukprot:COSAG03_NODE_5349_length_1269_cov_1.364103_2_plen_78_part_00
MRPFRRWGRRRRGVGGRGATIKAGRGMDLVLGFRLFALAVAFASGLAGLLCACGSLSVCLPACLPPGLSVLWMFASR